MYVRRKLWCNMVSLSLTLVLIVSVLASCGNKEKVVKTEVGHVSEAFMDPIKTDAGYISGALLGEPGKEVHIYRGIPYAAPPVGELRWKPPQPVASWSGVRECTVFSFQAAQWVNPKTVAAQGFEEQSSEDCLYLNIVTPVKKPLERLPVMVWFHGGGYYSGNANIYTSPALALHGVVLVTVNQRLGVLGLLAHPLLSEESQNGVSGNYMFLDQIAALQWVQKNIAAFGGDPNNVTIFGESGGSAKVINMMASPMAKGLFHRAIGESGGANGIPLKDMEVMGDALFAKLGVDKEKDPLAAARKLSWEKIIEAIGYESPTCDLAVDGWFMPDTPANIFDTGKQNVVPFIMGANLGELTGPGIIVMPQIVPFYVRLFSGASKVNGHAYAYLFTHVPVGWEKEGCVAFHGIELQYVFGLWADLDKWAGYFTEYGRSAGAKQPDPGITDLDRKISESMMTIWVQFARTGDPSVNGLITWPAYEMSKGYYLDIGEKLQIKLGYSNVITPT